MKEPISTSDMGLVVSQSFKLQATSHNTTRFLDLLRSHQHTTCGCLPFVSLRVERALWGKHRDCVFSVILNLLILRIDNLAFKLFTRRGLVPSLNFGIYKSDSVFLQCAKSASIVKINHSQRDYRTPSDPGSNLNVAFLKMVVII